MRLRGFLGIPDAAAYLMIHKYTLRDYISQGRVNTIKVGTRSVLEESELERLKLLQGQYGSLAKAFKGEDLKQSTPPNST